MWHLLREVCIDSVAEPDFCPLSCSQQSQSADTNLLRWRKVQCLLKTPSKKSRSLVLRRPGLLGGFQGRDFKDRIRECLSGTVISSWTFFWLVGGEVSGSQHHQPSDSNWSEVLHACEQHAMNRMSSTWWGFQYLQNSSNQMAENITYSPWGGTKGLCLMD